MAALLSIIVPSHNTRALTLRCLESIVQADGQAGSRAEVILVDDAGTDGTAEAVAERFPEAALIRTEEPAGFTRAANLGMARASGGILLLLNSDTEVDAPGLAALQAAFAADPRLGAAGADLYYPDGSAQWSGGRAPSLAWLFALASGAPGLLARLPFYRRVKPPGQKAGAVDWVTGAALALRRRAWEEVGPMDEAFFMFNEDVDWCRRFKLAGWAVAYVPAAVVTHHIGASKGRVADRVILERHRGMIHYFRKHHPTNRVLEGVAASFIMLRARLMLAANARKGR